MNKRKTIVTIGMFDGVHFGHRFLLRELDRLARKLNYQPAVITFDKHPLSVLDPEKCPKLLIESNLKYRLLESFENKVAMIIPTKEILACTASEFIYNVKEQLFNVKAVLVGYNNTFGSDQPGIEELRKNLALMGVDLYECPEYEKNEVNSSLIRREIEKGNITLARELLPTGVEIAGNVVHGKHLGTKLGFPTANLDVNKNIIVPGPGVYAGFTLGFPAMINIGTAPTVTDEKTQKIEVHIIKHPDYIDNEDPEMTEMQNTDNLYGKKLHVLIIDKIRDEQKFENIDELKKQLEKDREKAIEIVNKYVKNPMEE